MTIIVCPFDHVPAQIAAHKPDRIISLLDPGAAFPETGYGPRHLKLAFHDVERAEDWETAPNMEHVREVVAFVRSWKREAPLLIHCRAGISRSTATAFVAACVLNPDADERDIARALRAASPRAFPNPAIVALADDALLRRGRMKKGFKDVFGKSVPFDVMENEPFQLASKFGAPR